MLYYRCITTSISAFTEGKLYGLDTHTSRFETDNPNATYYMYGSPKDMGDFHEETMYSNAGVFELVSDITTVNASDFAIKPSNYIIHSLNEQASKEAFSLVNGATISVDGTTVIVEKDGAIGKAYLHPDDTFDLATGIKVALEKLSGANKEYSNVINLTKKVNLSLSIQDIAMICALLGMYGTPEKDKELSEEVNYLISDILVSNIISRTPDGEFKPTIEVTEDDKAWNTVNGFVSTSKLLQRLYTVIKHNIDFYHC